MPQILCEKRMNLQLTKPFSLVALLFIPFLLILSYGTVTAADGGTTSIGAIIDDSSRAGKEQKTAIKIAVQNFSNSSRNHNFSIHFRNSTDNPLQAARAADDLIKNEKVEVIVGMQTWRKAAIVADVGNGAKVPVISVAAAATTPPLAQVRWPFLVQMARNSSEEISSVAAIVHSYNWKRIIALYEDNNAFGGDSGALALLSEALQGAGSQIEHTLVFPPFSSLSNPHEFVRDKVDNLLSKNSRVFIILGSSIELATHLFREAQKIGLMGRDSVWIITDSITSILDSADPSFISSMEGVIGTKLYYSEQSRPFLDFKAQFRQVFRSDYPGEDSLMPGIHALRAYDSVMAISEAVTRLGTKGITSEELLKAILSSNFNGLSDKIHFQDGVLSENPVFKIINVVGKSYKELGFWSSKSGFSTKVDQNNGDDNIKILTPPGRVVNWPGDLTRDPRGWAMPSDTKPMRIGVPGRTSFEKFVKVEAVENSDEKKYSGFCIDIFDEVRHVLEQQYPLPYEFIPFNGTYEELVDGLFDNKNFDAVVGDVTILANRSKYVEYTQPFAESGLSMLVQYKHEPSRAWMFVKPFTVNMWIATFAILCFTMFVVWSIEHQSNPAFNGEPKDQLGTVLWFIFSSLFFAHKEELYSHFSKTVVVVWLFVVLILSNSYTASLSSMLTVPKLEPKVKNIEWIKRTNAPVGCDGDSFVNEYLKNVLRLTNVKTAQSQKDYPDLFKNGTIAAAFLELPYQKVFLQENCNEYTAVGPTYRFGGFGFVFKKGSPIASDASEAILTISENGILEGLERKWFPNFLNCSKSDDSETESLSLRSFWGIYLISGLTSTACLVIFLVRLILERKAHGNNITTSADEEGTWRKAIKLFQLLKNKGTPRISPARAPSFSRSQTNDGWNTSRWELVSPSETVEHPVRPTQLEIPMRNIDNIVSHI